MGLTIHSKLAVAENLTEEAVRDLAEHTAQYARKIGRRLGAETGVVQKLL